MDVVTPTASLEQEISSLSEQFEAQSHIYDNLHAELVSSLEKYQSLSITADGNELESRISVLMIELRSVNRLLSHITNQKNKLFNNQVQSLNEQDLGLQSVLYEKAYLTNMVRSEQAMHMEYADLDLISEKEFVTKSNMSQEELAKLTPHQVMLARLQDEIDERKTLHSKIKVLEVRERAMRSNNTRKLDTLGRIDDEVNALYSTAKEVGQSLFSVVGLSTVLPIPSEASLLPLPLSILFRSALSYQVSFAANMKVTIIGDVDLARVFNIQQHTTSPLDTYPLQIELSMPMSIPHKDDQFVVVELVVYFHPHLNTCSVTSKLFAQMGSVIQPVTTDIHTATLVSLFPADDGLTWPSGLNAFLDRPIPIDQIQGRPYRWLQALCGLHFPYEQQTVTYPTNFATWYRQLEQRTRHRLSLANGLLQVKDMRRLLPDFMPKGIRLSTFEPLHIDHHNSQHRFLVRHAVPVQQADDVWFHGCMIRTRGNLTCKFGVCFSPEYPLKAPLFVVELPGGVVSSASLAAKKFMSASAQEAAEATQVFDNRIAVLEKAANVSYYTGYLDDIKSVQDHLPQNEANVAQLLRHAHLQEENGTSCLFHVQLHALANTLLTV